MIYEITEEQYTEINNQFPISHSFGFLDNEDLKYYYDDSVLEHYDFDVNQVFVDLYGDGYIEFIENLNAKSDSNLKILRYLDPNTRPIQNVDFTTVGLIKSSPQYIKGRKESSEYHADLNQTDLIVKKYFEDVNGEDEYGETRMIGINITFEWYDENAMPALWKTIFVPLNQSEVYDLQVKRRQKAINYLIGNAKATPLGPVIDQIVSRYKNEIELFIEIGAPDFALRVIHESGQPWKGYLDYIDNDGIETYFPDGYSVREIILFQIT